VLQQNAPSCAFGVVCPELENEETSLLFAQLIARTAKDIDTLIDTLPGGGDELNRSALESRMRQLDIDNQQAGKELEAIVLQGQQMIDKLQNALNEIAAVQMQSRPTY